MANQMNDFINQWVAPYYLNILHGNFCLLEGEEQVAFNQSVMSALKSINTQVVDQLLSSVGWREQITGSWFCGLKGWSQFADVIGTRLVESKVTYAGQGHSFALACFANSKSIEYLTKYLDVYLPQTDLVYDQAWVMPALMWVDEKNNTGYSARYLTSDGLWEQYIVNKDRDAWRLDDRKDEFWKLMNYCQKNFGDPKAG